nr:dicarboxylate/amino acid:cation symporter [Cellulomonas sp. PhB143]
MRLPSFSVQIVLGLVLGILLGWLALSMGPVDAGTDAESPNWLTTTLDTIGSSFVTLLKAVVPPLVFTAIVASIANLRKVTNAARLAGQTLLWFAITALISVTVGIGLGLLFQPGNNSSLSPDQGSAPDGGGTWMDFLDGLIPGNFLGIGAGTELQTGTDGATTGATTSISFNVLQIVVVALVVGIAALKVGRKADPFVDLNRSALAVIQTVLWWIIRLAPLGTLGLIGNAIATYGWDLLAPLATFALAIYTGLFVVLFVVYPLVLRSNGLKVMSYFRGAWPAIQLAFVSRSSIGTLPVTQRVVERNLGVPREYASFAVPLASTTKMDGCASIYPAISAIFVAQIFDIHLTITDYLLIAFVSVVGSAATAGLTGALVMLTLTLSTLGLPLAGVGLLIAIDPILDMGRTAVNVAGQALVPTVVAKREGIIDLEQYESSSTEDLFSDDEVEDDGVAADQDAVADETGGRTPSGARERELEPAR